MGDKPKRRWYPILMVIMCIRMVLHAAISFRAVPKAVHIVLSQFEAVKNQRIPSYKNISRWLTQIGLYKLRNLKEQANDWALIVDHSIQVGTHKCLVILGIRLSQFQGRALTFEDMEPILIECHEQSNEQVIFQALQETQEKIGRVSMVCVDDGTDLRKGVEKFCEKSGAKKVLDTIHKLGTFLKAIFECDDEWQLFCSEVATAKSRMQQTKAAYLAPPNQRSKCRFLNIEGLVGWAVNALAVLRGNNKADRLLLEEYCGWLHSYQALIERLRQFTVIGGHVRQYVREHGLRRNTGDEIRFLLEELSQFFPFDCSACQFIGKIMDFFDEQCKVVPKGEIWIGSSEIIESVFGKLKRLEGDHSKGGFTSLVLGVAACVGQTDVGIVRAAMEQVSNSEVNKWTREQLGITLLAKRRKAFGKNFEKSGSNKVVQESAEISLGKAEGF